MYCYDATKGKPEGDLNPTQQEAFQNMDTLFKAALLSVLDDSIVDSYMSFDSGKDMWAALEATFGPSGCSCCFGAGWAGSSSRVPCGH